MLRVHCIIIIAGGIERKKIFQHDSDRNDFLERLEIILEETHTACYACALIPNHFHLLLRTDTAPVSNVMRPLLTGYAVFFQLAASQIRSPFSKLLQINPVSGRSLFARIDSIYPFKSPKSQISEKSKGVR